MVGKVIVAGSACSGLGGAGRCRSLWEVTRVLVGGRKVGVVGVRMYCRRRVGFPLQVQRNRRPLGVDGSFERGDEVEGWVWRLSWPLRVGFLTWGLLTGGIACIRKEVIVEGGVRTFLY